MSSRFEQNRREERRRVGEREDGGGWWCVYTEDALCERFLPWMGAVVSLRVRDRVKGEGGGGGEEKKTERKD